MNNIITQEALKELLDYNKELDQFIWKINSKQRKIGDNLDMSKQRVFLKGKEYRLNRLKELYLSGIYGITKVDKIITWDQLNNVLRYETASGIFYWKETRGTMIKGSIAGSIENTGYISIRIGGTAYLAHRLVWFYTYKSWPENNIDHIDRDPTNNRIENLRDVTQLVNGKNRLKNKNNTSGYKGVYFDKNKSIWIAETIINRIKYRLGNFKTAELANISYIEFEKAHNICE